MTICPGKNAPTSLGGHAWVRDLTVDVQAIHAWGALVVVTLMEAWELAKYEVSALGQTVTDRGIRWMHLPIVDGAAPDKIWDQLWTNTHGPALHQVLGEGDAILIHCLGGRGRTGTVAARLLIDFGLSAEQAIQQVRSARDGMIETAAQETYLRELDRAGPTAKHCSESP